MSVKRKFFIEVVILIILLSLLPWAWRVLVFDPTRQEFSSGITAVLETLVDIPSKTVQFTGKPYELYEQDPPSNTAFQLKNLDGSIKFKWEKAGQEVYLTVDPNSKNYKLVNKPVVVRFILGTGPGSAGVRRLPLAIIKDQRALDVIRSTKTGGTVKFQEFTNQSDGLIEISVSNTDVPDYVGNIGWQFEQEKLPFDISTTAGRLNGSSDINRFFPHPLAFFNADFTGLFYYGVYMLWAIVLLWIPVSLFAVLSYFIGMRLFRVHNLRTINIVFIPLGILLYLIYYRIILRFIFSVIFPH